ncbi:MAG: OmpA family protein [Planctomycetes bacterium]|nr:OmpA family protein [Planctomycetota bacterium]
MRKPFIAFCGAAAFAVAGSGCVSMAEYDDLKARYSAVAESNQRLKEDLGRENANLRLQVETGSAHLETSKVMLDATKNELDAAKAIAAEIRDKFANLVPPSGSNSSDSDIHIEGNWIRLSGEVLFDAGKTEIKASGKQLLLGIAKELKEKGMFVQIDGHTDTDPIKRSVGKFPTGSNFELGAERALAVTMLLQKEGGIDASKLHLTSWGEYQPAEAGNKRKNRRVEIRFSETDTYQTGGEVKAEK